MIFAIYSFVPHIYNNVINYAANLTKSLVCLAGSLVLLLFYHPDTLPVYRAHLFNVYSLI